jgi:hypothetical protein
MTPSPTFIRRIFMLAALVVCALGASTSSASAKLLWTANAERPWNQEWANYSCQNGNRIDEVTSPVAQGNRAYRIEVRDGDDSYGERCELGQGNPTRSDFPLFHEGDERWISYQMRIPDDVTTDTDTWQVVMQLKQLGSLGTPAVSMGINQGDLILMNSDTNHESEGCNWWWHGPAYKNRWLKFTYHIKFSPKDKVGYIELYGDMGDGQGMHLLMDKTHMHTQKIGLDGKTVDSHARIGFYRQDSIKGTSHMYYDGYTVGTDRESVEAAAYGDSNDYVSPAKPASAPSSSHAKRRVWLRLQNDGLKSASATTPWGRILQVYGGVHGKKRARKSRRVVVQMRRAGHWVSLTRGWMRRNGRFYLAPAINTDGAKVVKLRAVVKGLGHSQTLRVHVG